MTEILAFYDYIESNPQMTDTCICLWHALMYQANKTGWKREFSVAISTLELRTSLKRNAIYTARNKLKQFGLIDFNERTGNLSSIYTINSFVSFKQTQDETQPQTQTDTQGETQPQNINKQNKTKRKNKDDEINSVDLLFDEIWVLIPSHKNDRKSKVGKERKKELAKYGYEKIKAACENYLKTQNPQYLHRRDNFFNEIIDNYLNQNFEKTEDEWSDYVT